MGLACGDGVARTKETRDARAVAGAGAVVDAGGVSAQFIKDDSGDLVGEKREVEGVVELDLDLGEVVVEV